MDHRDHLFVVEFTVHNYQQSSVQEFTTDGTFNASIGRLSIAGTPNGSGVFFGASGIATDGEGRVFVTDTGIPRTQVFSNDRAYLYEWPSQGNSIALDRFGHAFVERPGADLRPVGDSHGHAELGPGETPLSLSPHTGAGV
jgi:hypothetical protein